MTGRIRLSPRPAAFLGGLTALALLFFGLTGIVWRIAGDADAMTRGMLRFAPPERTGLPEDLYPEMGCHITEYLTGKKASFQFSISSASGETVLFHDYEIAHMSDCRRLLALDRTVCLFMLGLGLIGLTLAAGLAHGARCLFLRGGQRGLLSFGLIAAVLTIWALVNFDGFFITFHRLAFSNELWLLNPRTDLLIRLMPETLFMSLGCSGLPAAGIWIFLLTLGFRLSLKKSAEKETPV